MSSENLSIYSNCLSFNLSELFQDLNIQERKIFGKERYGEEVETMESEKSRANSVFRLGRITGTTASSYSMKDAKMDSYCMRLSLLLKTLEESIFLNQ